MFHGLIGEIENKKWQPIIFPVAYFLFNLAVKFFKAEQRKRPLLDALNKAKDSILLNAFK